MVVSCSHVPEPQLGLMAFPNRLSLVGLHFFHQALVLDPAANNAAGAVLSAAAEAVIGHW